MDEFKIKFNPDDGDAFAEDVFAKIIPDGEDEATKKKSSLYGEYVGDAGEIPDNEDVFVDDDVKPEIPPEAPEKKDDKNEKTVFFVATIIIVLLAGLCGYLLASLKYKKEIKKIVTNDAIVDFSDDKLNTDETQKLSDAYRFILKNYYKEILPDDLIEGAIKGMTEVANDPYTHYYSPEKMNQYENLVNGVDENGEKIDVVSSKELDNYIKYVKIDRFSEGSSEAFRNEMTKLSETATDGIIIDLRGNPGGYADEAIAIADIILPKGTTATAIDRDGNTVRTAESDENEINVPVVLLVNGNTASAAELLTGAFRDFKKGDIIGTKTYGKALAQIRITFESDNSGIVLSTYKYLTPSGECIDGVGITPTIEVEDDSETEVDEQLEIAIQVLREAKKG